MIAKPSVKLDPRIKTIWRITDSLGLLIVFGCIILGCVASLSIEALSSSAEHVIMAILGASSAMLCIGLIATLFVIPPIRFGQWRYEISPEFLEVTKGIIWLEHYVIPFIRVQDTDTRQGPLQRIFGLATVTVSTAATEHSIPGIDFHTAELLRDKAAEYARVAKEDV